MRTLKTLFYHINGTPTAEAVGSIGNKPGDNYIKAEVYYNEGGYGFMSGNYTQRGYYMSVYTIGRGKDQYGHWEQVSLFGTKGAKCLISEVARQSKKKAEEAIQFFDENIDAYVRKTYPQFDVELERTA